ncbi:MAG: hypothetical protein K9M07_06110 [Simkaniaceae bacterium]|nr:hypothetical protein [Simkaniaceae bacterium]
MIDSEKDLYDLIYNVNQICKELFRSLDSEQQNGVLSTLACISHKVESVA